MPAAVRRRDVQRRRDVHELRGRLRRMPGRVSDVHGLRELHGARDVRLLSRLQHVLDRRGGRALVGHLRQWLGVAEQRVRSVQRAHGLRQLYGRLDVRLVRVCRALLHEQQHRADERELLERLRVAELGLQRFVLRELLGLGLHGLYRRLDLRLLLLWVHRRVLQRHVDGPRQLAQPVPRRLGVAQLFVPLRVVGPRRARISSRT